MEVVEPIFQGITVPIIFEVLEELESMEVEVLIIALVIVKVLSFNSF
jgi:hypothetical protein